MGRVTELKGIGTWQNVFFAQRLGFDKRIGVLAQAFGRSLCLFSIA